MMNQQLLRICDLAMGGLVHREFVAKEKYRDACIKENADKSMATAVCIAGADYTRELEVIKYQKREIENVRNVLYKNNLTVTQAGTLHTPEEYSGVPTHLREILKKFKKEAPMRVGDEYVCHELDDEHYHGLCKVTACMEDARGYNGDDTVAARYENGDEITIKRRRFEANHSRTKEAGHERG